MRSITLISRWLLIVVAVLSVFAVGQDSSALPPRVKTGRLRVGLTRVVSQPPSSSLAFPTIGLAFEPENSSRMYFLEKGTASGGFARVRLLNNGVYSTVLDLTAEVDGANENGLLGMSFHPGFANSESPGYRKFYTYHSALLSTSATADFTSPFTSTLMHHNVITEWQVDAGNPNVVDLATRREVLRELHHDFEHNAGSIAFGPDGYLYGAIGAPFGTAAENLASQDKTNLLGKVIRIDPLAPSATPDSANPLSANGKYRIPADNPFVSEASSLDEIYAYGFRNPYRFSVDQVSGKMFVGDVGQNTTEEVSVIVSGGNYGWPYRQGNDPGTTAMPGSPPVLQAPIAEYQHLDGRAITGGYVYRGPIEALQGKYIYGDFSTNFFSGRGKLFVSDVFDESGNLKNPADVRVEQILTDPTTCAQNLNVGCGFDTPLFSFAEDSDGNLYTLSTGANRAVVYKLTSAYYLPEGDFNEDGKVDAVDYTVWRDSLGQSVAFGQKADGDGDGVIDADDYNIWKAHFGESINLGSGAIAGVVPELSSFTLAFTFFGIAASRIRRR
jgi:glucose/arabinose dehydrogenase